MYTYAERAIDAPDFHYIALCALSRLHVIQNIWFLPFRRERERLLLLSFLFFPRGSSRRASLFPGISYHHCKWILPAHTQPTLATAVFTATPPPFYIKAIFLHWNRNNRYKISQVHFLHLHFFFKYLFRVYRGPITHLTRKNFNCRISQFFIGARGFINILYIMQIYAQAASI